MARMETNTAGSIAGLWVSDKAPGVAIYVDDASRQRVVGIYNGLDSNSLSVAMYAGPAGSGIQLSKGDRVLHLDFDKLEKLLQLIQ